MKKKILISMYSLHIGGAERSLIGLLESFDYKKFDVDLFLYRQEGEFLRFIPKEVNLLPTIKQYTTFERPVKDIIKEGHFFLGSARIAAKFKSKMKNRGQKKDQGTYKQMQYTWFYSMPGLPRLNHEYDLAISFLGPHNFILDKVKAKKKIGWNHTDYFTIVNPDKKLDEKMWSKLDYIVNVSKACEDSFLKVFPNLKHKTIVLENIISPTFVREQAKEEITEIIHDKSTKICSVGRLSHAKGFDMAILACKKLVESGYKVKWYVVGYGGEEVYLKQLIKDNNLTDQFILLGKKVNPYPFIKNCEIYCQPSRYEGKAVTVREAQILEKPVIITNYPTANSQLEDRIDGLICDLSVEGIVNAIKRLYMDLKLRNKLSNNCIKKDYGNISEINKLYNLLNQLENKEENKKVIL
ncbi:glycosyltransferase [Metabacillus sediminilitoris]|uniref:Glycosyltransferase n=1 Tax=Metabacillus sediminilitoris TaxID=2567941 RepID=A0A4S4BZE1_9BACI|nr:glycosyltransferase [Metabacillus sediminilitoris]QGQ47219.1 glycosyltransferase [Metabacillus sediminilitoris]THF80563.1 glycosyltransferase [Metabacillus sediminilitoris]